MNKHLKNAPYNRKIIVPNSNENQYVPNYSQRKSRSIIKREALENEDYGNSEDSLMNNSNINQYKKRYDNNKKRVQKIQYNCNNSTNPVLTQNKNGIIQSKRKMHEIKKYFQHYNGNKRDISMTDSNRENILEEGLQDNDSNFNEKIKYSKKKLI